MTDERNDISDEVLTAFLDGELAPDRYAALEQRIASDPAIEARLTALALPIPKMRSALDPVALDAPYLPDLGLTAPPQRAGGTARKLWAPLALAASFALGLGLSQMLTQPPQLQAPAGWLATVASYQSLYIPETLDGPPQNAERAQNVLARAEQEFGLSLQAATTIDGMPFKRAQMLGLNGKPLLQIAYLTPDGVPMALCLIRVNKPDRARKDTTLFELSGTSWVKDGVGYFLIGGDDPERVTQLSQSVIRAL